MKEPLNHFAGIVGAFIVWWAAAVLLGMLCFAIWPPEGSHTAGISLEPQNVPGNLLGFVLALYAFRAIISNRNQKKNDQKRDVQNAEPDARPNDEERE